METVRHKPVAVWVSHILWFTVIEALNIVPLKSLQIMVI